jgi:hypothetical protein
VLHTVAYSDVFDYPLQADEVHRYLHGARSTVEATAASLAKWSAPGGVLAQRNGFYMLRGREGLVDVRRSRTLHAARLWPAAVYYGHVIAALPFVRMVGVTGSLAWDNIDQGGDIDYLIVTEPDHLWTCRWLVRALARVARLRGVGLCPNYVLSKRALTLGEHNLFAAYELMRMTPIAGFAVYRRLRRANPWAARLLPNAVEPQGHPRLARTARKRLLARLPKFGERTLRSPLGALLERYEMNYRIRKMFRMGLVGEETAYGVDSCKAHTSGHRQRTLAAFAQRLDALSRSGAL